MPAAEGPRRKRPRSPLARHLDQAFAGVEVWSVAPGRRRAAGLGPPEWVSRGPAGPGREDRAAPGEP